MSRILAIDYGVKRMGLAISDPLGFTAQPFKVLERKSLSEDIKSICQTITENDITRIVMGLPLNFDGTPGILCEEVKSFGEKLQEKSGIVVELYDERLTTLQTERMLTEEADMSRSKRKKVRDKLAASLILRSYLEHKKENERIS